MGGTVHAYTDSHAFGGAEESLAILLTGLAARGWSPTLLHDGHPGLTPLLTRLEAAGIGARSVAAMPEGRRGIAPAAALTRRLRRDRPDVFHAALIWPLACKWALLAACAARVPAVVGTAHLFTDTKMGPSRRAQVRLLSRGVDRILAVSADTRERFHAELGWPLERLGVVPNAVEVEHFTGPRNPALRAALEDGSGRPIALVPARLEEQKGHRHLLAAARSLPGVRFACAGDGALRAELEAEAERLGVAERVTFLGFRSDLRELLLTCDLVVLPSLYEGLPLAVIEAMAAGAPIVATDVGGTRELVVAGETGLLVAPGDPAALAGAIAALVADPALARSLGKAGRHRACERYSATAMVDAVAGEYERLLPDRAVPTRPQRVLA